MIEPNYMPDSKLDLDDDEHKMSDEEHKSFARIQEERDRQADEYVSRGLCEHGKQHGECESCKMINESDWYIWRNKQGKSMDNGYSW